MAGEAEKLRFSGSTRTLLGFVYVCIDPECDAVRKVWSDGTKDIVKEGLPEKEL